MHARVQDNQETEDFKLAVTLAIDPLPELSSRGSVGPIGSTGIVPEPVETRLRESWELRSNSFYHSASAWLLLGSEKAGTEYTPQCKETPNLICQESKSTC